MEPGQSSPRPQSHYNDSICRSWILCASQRFFTIYRNKCLPYPVFYGIITAKRLLYRIFAAVFSSRFRDNRKHGQYTMWLRSMVYYIQFYAISRPLR